MCQLNFESFLTNCADIKVVYRLSGHVKNIDKNHIHIEKYNPKYIGNTLRQRLYLSS